MRGRSEEETAWKKGKRRNGRREGEMEKWVREKREKIVRNKE